MPMARRVSVCMSKFVFGTCRTSRKSLRPLKSARHTNHDRLELRESPWPLRAAAVFLGGVGTFFFVVAGADIERGKDDEDHTVFRPVLRLATGGELPLRNSFSADLPREEAIAASARSLLSVV